VMKINELRAARFDAVATCRALTEKHLNAARTGGEDGQGRGFTGEERRLQKEAEDALVEIDQQILAEHQRLDRETRTALPGSQLRTQIGPHGEMSWLDDAAQSQAGVPARGSFARAAREMLASQAPIAASDYAGLIRDLQTGNSGGKYFATGGQNESVGSEGAFAVAPTFANRFWTLAAAKSVAMRVFMVNLMKAREHVVPMLDDFNRLGNSIAEVNAAWTQEATSIALSTAKLVNITLRLNKAAVRLELSNELLSDSFVSDIVGEFEAAMTAAITGVVDGTTLLTGTGSAMPLSIVNSGACIKVAPLASQPVGTLKYENLLAMLAALPAESQGRFVWIASPSVIPSLYTLSFATGTASGSAPAVFQQLAGDEYRLLGRPLLFTPQLAPLGTVGDILCVDGSQYCLGVFGGIQLARSQDIAFDRDVLMLRAILRVDGQPAWRSPRTDQDGAQRSPFVAVQTRTGS
jgi:HK97 family phage major capsid protein